MPKTSKIEAYLQAVLEMTIATVQQALTDAFLTLSHGGRTHSHVPPERAGLAGLLSLGISGGIVPRVDALIGLLFAISLGKLVWGLIILHCRKSSITLKAMKKGDV